MKTLYDIIGARSDDDAENLKKAYRQAAKANHPDHHAGDPAAALRFRRIAAAYDVLRDAEQRAAYDRLLEVRRRPLRTKLRHAILEMRRHVVYDTMIAAAVTAMLIGGYTLVSRISSGTGTEVETAGVAVGESARTAAGAAADRTVGAGQSRPAAPQMPIVLPATTIADASAVNDRAPEEARAESVPDAVVPRVAVPEVAVPEVAIPGVAVPDVAVPAIVTAKRDDDRRDAESDGPINRPAPTDAAGDPGSSPRLAPLERSKAPSVEASSAGVEKRGGTRSAFSRPPWSRVSWSHAAASGDRRDGRTSDAKTLDTRAPDLRTSDPAGVNAGPQPALRRPVPGRPAFEHAALQNRNNPAGDPPPLFGVGF